METIRFVFDGQLADHHKMDFYESARFQYAAARLSVKLDQFRRKGSFSAKVTAKNNTSVEVKPFERGSFGIEIIGPVLAIAAPIFLEVPLTALWTYVVERVFKPAGDDTIRNVLDGNARLLKLASAQGERDGTIINEALKVLSDERKAGREDRAENRDLRA